MCGGCVEVGRGCVEGEWRESGGRVEGELRVRGGCVEGEWRVCGGCMEGEWWRVCGGCVEGEWRVSGGGCVEGVWRVSGGCVEGVWRVSGGCVEVCGGCMEGEWRRVCGGGCVEEGVWRVSGGCVEGVWRVSRGCVEGVQRVCGKYYQNSKQAEHQWEKQQQQQNIYLPTWTSSNIFIPIPSKRSAQDVSSPKVKLGGDHWILRLNSPSLKSQLSMATISGGPGATAVGDDQDVLETTTE